MKKPVGISVTGRAPAALVWTRYTRPQLWSSWSPQISGVDCADEVIGAGTTGVVHAVLGVRVRFEVTEVDDLAMRWAWTVHLPLRLRLRLRHWVDPAPGGGSRTGLLITGPAPVVLGYLPVARLALTRLVRPRTG